MQNEAFFKYQNNQYIAAHTRWLGELAAVLPPARNAM
jgi:hypothetical protein